MDLKEEIFKALDLLSRYESPVCQYMFEETDKNCQQVGKMV